MAATVDEEPEVEDPPVEPGNTTVGVVPTEGDPVPEGEVPPPPPEPEPDPGPPDEGYPPVDLPG